jgi:hypothetical protein
MIEKYADCELDLVDKNDELLPGVAVRLKRSESPSYGIVVAIDQYNVCSVLWSMRPKLNSLTEDLAKQIALEIDRDILNDLLNASMRH